LSNISIAVAFMLLNTIEILLRVFVRN